MMRNTHLSLVMTLCMLAFSAFSYAQVLVTGVVLDAATDEPIIGANIVEVGTSNGTITDFDGNFEVNVQSGAQLEFSYMGYKTQVLPAQAVMKIKLGEDTEQLEELVVVGYGTVKKNDATGSVTAIKPDEMNKGMVTNAQDMLAGKVAGVQVTSDGGAPGAGSTIRIRGGSSLSASNSPLIVIDGMAMDNDGIKGVSNPLSLVNPNDIETFTVLKDASATAIYGSRASNGVIIITTKKGKNGSKPKFQYEGNVGASIITNRLEVMNGNQYRDFLTRMESVYGPIARNLGTDNTDWQKQITQVGISTDHNFSITGGTKHMPYRASLGYTLQNGTVKRSQMQRVTAALNLAPSFLDNHLSFNINAKGMYIYNVYTDGGGAVGSALAYDPTRPVYDDTYQEYGGYYQTPKAISDEDIFDPNWLYTNNSNVPKNPLAQLNLKDDKAHSGAFIGNAEVDYKIHGLEDLRLHASFAADYSYGKQNTVCSDYNYDGNNYYGWDGYTKEHKYNLQFGCYAQYGHDWENARQHFDIQAGYEWSHKKRWGDSGGNGMYKETYTKDKNMAGQPYNVQHSEWATENYLVSFYGRLNWIGWDQILLTATVRGDGSSRFSPKNSAGKNKQWGVFPSVALGWKIRESFFKDNTTLSEWKLRLGYGITGQQELGMGDYPAMLLYSLSKEHASYTLGEVDPQTGEYIYYTTSRPNAYNDDLTWEKTTTYNVGMDFGFLNNRITMALDYYYRKTTDLIAYVDVAAGMNFKNRVVSNIGSLSNQGCELTFNAVAIDRPRSASKFKWDLGLNFTYNVNKIISLTTGEGENYYVRTGGISAGTGNTIQRHQEGYAASTFFVYRTTLNENGGYQIIDQNGDAKIDENDLVAYHNPMAPFQIGFQTKFLFYNFDLGFSLRASIGNYVYNDVKAGRMTSLATPVRDGGYTNVLKGSEEIYARITNSDIKQVGYVSTGSNAFLMDVFVENASFLRIDNITLGYTFDKPKINARIYATVSNPLVITGYTGLDPEVFGGIDNNIYPRSLTALVGLSLRF